ncbi:MAG TPA: Imm26 family immunity protein [Steroidobacteraceae bacterium]|nr:Imm26 family immunity protein [Steroidobacteraceae bacterium]
MTWQCGDLFAVPQRDGQWSLGQVLLHEPRAMDSVLCGFYDVRLAEPQLTGVVHLLTRNRLVALELVTREALDRGRWPIVGNSLPANLGAYRGLGALYNGRYAAVTVVPSTRIVALLEAWFGLRPWRGGPDPQALERLLFPH